MNDHQNSRTLTMCTTCLAKYYERTPRNSTHTSRVQRPNTDGSPPKPAQHQKK